MPLRAIPLIPLRFFCGRNLFSPNYFERYIAENGLEVTKKVLTLTIIIGRYGKI